MNSTYRHSIRPSPYKSGKQQIVNQQLVSLNPVARAVVGLMQLKDTIQIGVMLYSGAIFFGIIGGVGIPGLVLYALRWRQLKRGSRRGTSLVLAVLGMLHELFWAINFPLDGPPPAPDEEYPIDVKLYGDSLRVFYWFGAVLMLLVLLACLWPVARPQMHVADVTSRVEDELG